ncbi:MULTISPECIES: hypothetical protein [Nocardiaceae]|jgi:hypothetical protein|nr:MULTISPECIES: hypothetical protein [Rhodococcus]KQU27753.1 hypothetical protein ASH04_23030 [Rhodococcus sp. Leaf233]
MAWDPMTTDSQDSDERGLRVADDVGARAWLLEEIGKFGSGVAALVPNHLPVVRANLSPGEDYRR